VNLARTAIALERCRLARGEFPAALEMLAPQCIDTVPQDVIGDQGLKYRQETSGRFLLYSVGWNETDEGGVTSLKQDGSVEIGCATGCGGIRPRRNELSYSNVTVQSLPFFPRTWLTVAARFSFCTVTS
jgi:hypothetical protein